MLDILKRYQVEEGQSGAELQGAQGLEQRGHGRHMTQSFKQSNGMGSGKNRQTMYLGPTS